MYKRQILYNKDMFEENGWEIPATWSEFTDLCETIQNTSDVYPLYLGYKDTWTCMAPWNALAVGLSSPSTCSDVNAGKTTFSDAYQEVAEKDKALLEYAEPNPYAYSYNDACTAFARGESAMYPIGSYAVPQIQSVNPDMNIDSFVFPANEDEARTMLRELSGRTHQVATGVCIVKAGDATAPHAAESLSFVDVTDVTFYELTDEQIERYVASGEPMDQAGAYGIQGHGALLIKGIEGDYYSVMGLPVAPLYTILRDIHAV